MASTSPAPTPARRHLFDHASKPDKTIDIGRNGVTLSLDAQGRILLLSAYHEDWGIILAEPFGQFDGARFRDPDYVREYRTRSLRQLYQHLPGFGLDFGNTSPVSIQLPTSYMARYRILGDNSLDMYITVTVRDDGSIEQSISITNNGDTPIILPYNFDLSASLNRASYAQLTEGGPLPLPLSHNVLRNISLSTMQISNPELGAQLLASLTVNGQPHEFEGFPDQQAINAPLKARTDTFARVQPGTTLNINAMFQLLPHLRRGHTLRPCVALNAGTIVNIETSQWRLGDLLTTYILQRNVDYILGNCVVPVDEGAVAIIPDHVALPLGWTRDNYWQVRLLFETHANISSLVRPSHVRSYQEQIQSAVRGHLQWLFSTAERPHGFYHRSYLVNGRPKDGKTFQLDQQCYPLLELCDYLVCFPEDCEFAGDIVRSGVVQEILALLESKCDPITGLVPADETPADDPLAYPYHFSSHVLLWRTLNQIRELFVKLNIDVQRRSQHLERLASELRGRIMEAFVADDGKGSRIFAYCTDGGGKFQFYHDGNDMPTLFAYEWGFVSSAAEIEIWKQTMAFGLSSRNTLGYSDDGPYSGLGSVHSPGAWTLGYFQELAYAAYEHDEAAMQHAWNKIVAAMHWDGTFSEAVDSQTAKCTSKAWFSWPGAMIGVLLIKMRKTRQEEILLFSNQSACLTA